MKRKSSLLLLAFSVILIATQALTAKTKIESAADDEDEVKSTIRSDPYAGGGHRKTGSAPKTSSGSSSGLVSLNEKDGKIVVLQPIRFDDKNNLAIASQGIVLKLVDLLKKNPQTRTRIIVHTDSLGSDQKNIENSQKRAQSLGVYLIQNGIDMSRFELVGMGDREPVASDDTREGRQKNNRVDFLLITPLPTQATPPTPPPPAPPAPVTPPVPEAPTAPLTPPVAPAPEAPAVPSPIPPPPPPPTAAPIAPAPTPPVPEALPQPQSLPSIPAPAPTVPAPTLTPPPPSQMAPAPTTPPPAPVPPPAALSTTTPIVPAPIPVPTPPVAQ